MVSLERTIEHLLPLTVLLLLLPSAGSAQQTIRSVERFQPRVKWGGRSVAIATSGVSNRVAIIATESGGLFKTMDGGTTWTHLDGLPPFRMADVKFARLSPSIVVATALRDSRVTNRGGIWRSIDGGQHWQRPPTADPPAVGPCPARVSALGISFQPGTNNVFVGTTCGLAISHDLGATWEHVVVDPANPKILSVLALRNQVVYVCGLGGVRKSINQGATWGAPFSNLGACPDDTVHALDFSAERQSVFVTTGAGNLFKSDDQGANWTNLMAPDDPTDAGRMPFVRVSPARASNGTVDVYYGDGVRLFRRTCSPTNPSGLTCSGSSWGNELETGHSDPNDLAFGANECPRFVVTDAGVHQTVDCGTTWTNSGSGTAGFHALQIYQVSGQIHPDHTDVYIGTQDNGLWPSGNGGLSWSSEPFDNEGYGFQMERRRSDHLGRIIFWQAGGGISSTMPHFDSKLSWTGPPGDFQCMPTIIQNGVYAQFSQVQGAPGNTLFVTTNDGGVWTRVVTVQQSLSGCIQASGPANNPTLYQAIDIPGLTPGGDSRISLLRITGALGSGPVVVTRVNRISLNSLGLYCPGRAALNCPTVFAVNPTNPLHLLVPDIGTGQMKVSRNGGSTWSVDTQLTNLVTAQNTFSFNIPNGEEGVRMQVHTVAFDPDNGNHILVGTEAVGIIESWDGGASWNVIPFSSRVTGITSFFFTGPRTVLLSTYGRGLWKIEDLEIPPPRLCLQAGGCRIDLVDTELNRFPRNVCPHVPEPPTCHFDVVLDGAVRRLDLDSKGNVVRFAIDGRNVGAYDLQGKELDTRLPPHTFAKENRFPNCHACSEVVKRKGTIRGLALTKNSLLGLIVEFPEKAKVPTRPPTPISMVAGMQAIEEDLPYIQPTASSAFGNGQTTAMRGQTVTVYGSHFCGNRGCLEVTLKIDERVVADRIKPDSDGRFKAQFVVNELPGLYLITATQKTAEGKVLKDRKSLIVPVSENPRRKS